MARDRSSSPGTTAIPTTRSCEFDLSHERAVVVGNGNVAVDVARMLALTAEELAPTDTTDAAIDGDRRLGAQGDRDARPARAGAGGVHAAGAEGARRARRRGRRSSTRPTSSSTRRASASSRPIASARGATSSSCGSTPRARRRASRAASCCASCVSPVAILGDERVEAIEVVRNELVADDDGRIVARADGRARDDPVRASCCAASATAASRCRASRSTSDAARSRTTAAASTGDRAARYAAGWIKRGPSGVIGTNKKDATETVEVLLEDARAGRLNRASADSTQTLEALLGRARRRARRVRGLAGDRRRRARAPASRTAGRA